jgi:hypothetical protein
MTRRMPGPFAIALALGCSSAALASAGCDDKKTSDARPSSLDASAGMDKYATADPKLAKALQAAASATPGNENGPPPDGIFAPGVADKRHPKGAPTTVEMLSDGSEPRMALNEGAADVVRASSYGPAALELGMQMGPRAAVPTVDMSLSIGAAKKDDGGTDWLVAELKKATTSKEQFGDLPPGTDMAIATLEGTLLRVKLGPDGAESDLQVSLGKQAIAELGRLAQNAAEALVFATVPLPPKPVGVGAQWIAESRLPLSGLDVIAYRAFRVKTVEGNRVHLSLDVKAYATTSDTAMPEVPKGATLQQVDAQAQGEIELVRGEVLARKSQVQQRVVMVFSAPPGSQPPAQPGQPPPPATLNGQTMSQATFVRGDDLRAALRPR